jgi:integrase
MGAIKFTEKSWRTLGPAEDGSRKEYRATSPKGLWLRVGGDGTRTFGIVYWAPTGERRRATLGDASLVPWRDHVDASGKEQPGAETLAKRALADVIANKADPVADKRAARVEARRRAAEEAAIAQAGTLRHLVDAFLESREAKRWRPTTAYETRRLLKVEVVKKLGHVRPADLTRGDVRDLVESIADGKGREAPAPYVANRTLSAVKHVFAWAVDRGHVAASPVVGLKPPHEEKPRDVALSDDAIRAVLATLAEMDADTHDVVRLLWLTGCRLTEITGMTWDEVDFDREELRVSLDRVKTGRRKPTPRVVPLVEDALAILKRRRRERDEAKVLDLRRAKYVFPASRGAAFMARPTKVLSEVKRKTGADFFPHAIRHELKARLARLKVAPHVAERVLGHAMRGMEATYTSTGVAFLDEQRTALELWQGELRAILKAKRKSGKATTSGAAS